ncbi:MAG: glutamine--tRNA ligase/YqeY domain fusion protein [Acidimicrobiia bacterium]|nr:glutamine--tRNA ligase/YqeY domain fusion protein [Acidimicrobiia bacterium]
MSENGASPDAGEAPASYNFLQEIVAADVAAGSHGGRVVTRFPPEPNGYLHIGHAKSIVLNFGLAAMSPHGHCNLRFDDTNPETEETEFVEAIEDDVRWLGYDWGDAEYYASDYFERLYAFAVALVEKGLAYVDSQSPEDIRENRGDFHRPGSDSPYRDRSVSENLDLLARMRAGDFDEGDCVLRARIDMAHPDVLMRDPLIYRIRKAPHHRTGTAWAIYPMYDFAHPLSDAIEGVTHSVCTLEFQNNRALYDWFVANCEPPAEPHQYEFARLDLSYTVLSKRKLQQLVAGGHVDGWDDPRMPTLAGLRRRGVPPAAIREFCETIGVAKRDNLVDVALLEHVVRDHLNADTPRMMAVLRPLRVVIENWDDGRVELLRCPLDPDDPDGAARDVPLSGVLYVERDDFAADPPKKWFRLAPGREVRFRYACLFTCTDVVTDPGTGEVVELRGTWDPESLGGAAPDGRRVRGTLHWVSAAHAVDAEVRLYDRLFTTADPGAADDFLAHLNPESLETIHAAKLEPALATTNAGERVQFERLGYFCADPDRDRLDRPVFNRTIGLRDTWAKIATKS